MSPRATASRSPGRFRSPTEETNSTASRWSGPRSVPQVFDESLDLFEAVTVGLDRDNDVSFGEGDRPHPGTRQVHRDRWPKRRTPRPVGRLREPSDEPFRRAQASMGQGGSQIGRGARHASRGRGRVRRARRPAVAPAAPVGVRALRGPSLGGGRRAVRLGLGVSDLAPGTGCGQPGGVPAHDGRESAPELAPKEVPNEYRIWAEPASRAGPPTRTSTSSSSGSGLPSPTYRRGAER